MMHRPLIAELTLLTWLAAAPAGADRVTVKGTVLEGKVESVSGKTVVMTTVYGKGELVIKTADVEAIETDAPFHVFHGDDVETVGPIVGVTPEAVTLASTGAVPSEVPFAEVYAAPRDPGPDASWLARRPVELPYWSGNVDLSLSATESTKDASALAVGLGLRRERGPSRLEFEASYRRGTTQNDFAKRDPVTGVKDDGQEITADQLRGFLRQEYDLTSRILALGSFEAEHDGIESLAYRLIPKVGAGYKIVKTEKALLSVDMGPAYVYERFYDGSLNNYLALAIGAASDIELPWLGATWRTRLEYLPSVSDWMDAYRLRGETGLSIPLAEQLALKASLIDEYNSQPDEDTSANSLATLLGLSLTY
jgi:putative salt-induced outer membrane protein YdiY